MAPPSIKGSVFRVVHEDIGKLVSSGVLSREELARRLEPEDLAVLDAPVQLPAWYDIRMYARLLSLLLDVEGRGDLDYLRQRGHKSAELLIEAGIYQQVEYLSRAKVSKETDPEARFVAFGRDLRLVVSLAASVLNFSHFSVKPDPEHPRRHAIEVSDAGDFPDALMLTTEGFLNRLANLHDARDLWRGERMERDRILYRMTREL